VDFGIYKKKKRGERSDSRRPSLYHEINGSEGIREKEEGKGRDDDIGAFILRGDGFRKWERKGGKREKKKNAPISRNFSRLRKGALLGGKGEEKSLPQCVSGRLFA